MLLPNFMPVTWFFYLTAEKLRSLSKNLKELWGKEKVESCMHSKSWCPRWADLFSEIWKISLSIIKLHNLLYRALLKWVYLLFKCISTKPNQNTWTAKHQETTFLKLSITEINQVQTRLWKLQDCLYSLGEEDKGCGKSVPHSFDTEVITVIFPYMFDSFYSHRRSLWIICCLLLYLSEMDVRAQYGPFWVDVWPCDVTWGT